MKGLTGEELVICNHLGRSCPCWMGKQPFPWFKAKSAPDQDTTNTQPASLRAPERFCCPLSPPGLGDVLVTAPALLLSCLFGAGRVAFTALGESIPVLRLPWSQHPWRGKKLIYLLVCACNEEDNNKGTMPGSANNHPATETESLV